MFLNVRALGHVLKLSAPRSVVQHNNLEVCEAGNNFYVTDRNRSMVFIHCGEQAGDGLTLH